MAARSRVRLAARAEQDLSGILRWTHDQFGQGQAETYRDTVLSAIHELGRGPELAGARDRGDITPGLKSLHVARGGRRGRHLIFFRVDREGIIDILRILHEAMDFTRHFGGRDDPDFQS